MIKVNLVPSTTTTYCGFIAEDTELGFKYNTRARGDFVYDIADLMKHYRDHIEKLFNKNRPTKIIDIEITEPKQLINTPMCIED